MNHVVCCVRGAIKQETSKNTESSREGHYGEENTEKECQQENICTLMSGKLCSKDLHWRSTLFLEYSSAGKKKNPEKIIFV